MAEQVRLDEVITTIMQITARRRQEKRIGSMWDRKRGKSYD